MENRKGSSPLPQANPRLAGPLLSPQTAFGTVAATEVADTATFAGDCFAGECVVAPDAAARIEFGPVVPPYPPRTFVEAHHIWQVPEALQAYLRRVQADPQIRGLQELNERLRQQPGWPPKPPVSSFEVKPTPASSDPTESRKLTKKQACILEIARALFPNPKVLANTRTAEIERQVNAEWHRRGNKGKLVTFKTVATALGRGI